MDILNLANHINLELAKIRSRNQDILAEQEREVIFNSIITAVSENLLDSITFSISDRRTSQEVLSWEYDLHDKKYIQRRGPSESQLVHSISKMPNSVYIDCIPGWSSHFNELDPSVKAQILEDTIWAKKLQNVAAKESIFDVPSQSRPQSSSDLEELNSELNLLESNTNLLNRRALKKLLESVQMCFQKNCIMGIQLSITEPKKDQPLIRWKFTLKGDGTVVRKGTPIQQIIGIAKSLKRGANLITKPILSPNFQRLSNTDKYELMKDTVWASDYPRVRSKGLFG
jgi:hypothetical protein